MIARDSQADSVLVRRLLLADAEAYVSLRREMLAAHRMEVSGMYVDGGHRRRGLGRRLLDAAIAHARAANGIIQIHLGVTDAAPEELSLDESLGFRVWGIEPRALQHDGILIDERHMVLLFTT